MPRIALIGNCQAGSIAEAMRFMLPGSFVKTIISWETAQWYASEEACIADINLFDLVFSHDVAIAGTSIQNFEDLKARVPGAIKIPTLVFPAYHPDLVYVSVRNPTGDALLLSPLGAYNSAIALFAYRLQLNVRQALRLFDERVYEKLGYFDMWADSQAGLLQHARDCGVPLDTAFSRWVRNGCFMYSTNHARIEPLTDLAILLLRREGIQVETEVCDRYVADPAQVDAIWPLYPPIAARLGLQGNYMFKRPDYAATDGNKFFTLESFVQESFKSYGFVPVKNIYCERVDGWLENQALVSWIKSFANTNVRS